MKTTLFLTLLLFITACSDSTTEKAATQSEPEAIEATKAEEKPLDQQTPAETEPAPMKEAQASVEAAPAPVKTEPAPVETASSPAPAEPAAAETKVEAKKPAPVNGHTIFARQCASCHGQEAEKSALNTSKVIAGWDEKKVLAALKGYKENSYGGNLKAIMKGQVTHLSDEEMQAVAAYISTL